MINNFQHRHACATRKNAWTRTPSILLALQEITRGANLGPRLFSSPPRRHPPQHLNKCEHKRKSTLEFLLLPNGKFPPARQCLFLFLWHQHPHQNLTFPVISSPPAPHTPRRNSAARKTVPPPAPDCRSTQRTFFSKTCFQCLQSQKQARCALIGLRPSSCIRDQGTPVGN